MFEVNEKDRNQEANENQVLQKRKKKRGSETPEKLVKKGKKEKDPCQCFNQRISKRDMRGAVPAPSF
jgi:hypothetical protein